MKEAWRSKEQQDAGQGSHQGNEQVQGKSLQRQL